MKHNISYILILLSLLHSVYGQQTQSRNYIISRSYKQTGADVNDLSKVITQVQYIDGLGRKLQHVTVGQSPAGTDIVQPVEYDGAGRQPKQFMPYVASGNGAYHSSAVGEANTWYAANSAGLKRSIPENALDVSRAYIESIFEQSPLSRVISQKQPGGYSANSFIRSKVNCCGELIRYDYDKATKSVITPGGYAPGTVTYVQTKDEEGKTSTEYYDLSGRIICKQALAVDAAGPAAVLLSTYYVYDDMGLLRAVLQPNYQVTASVGNSAFMYDYDERGRVISKKIPGGGTVEIVYDTYDRPALSRDENQKARGVWGFVKYDALNRPVVTGEIPSADSWAAWVANVNSGTEHHEDRNNLNVEGYSLDKTAPKTATETHLLTITFYDDYAFSLPSQLTYSASYYSNNNGNVVGYQTGGRARMLPGNGGTGEWLSNVIYYDAEYRQIQMVRQLYDLGANAFERISTQFKYDLAAVASEQKTEQAPSGVVTNTHVATYSYDHADRILSVKEQVVLGTRRKEAFTVAQRYNTIGELKSKWFNSDLPGDGTLYRRRTDYTNNIRGWITDGNTVYKKTSSGGEQPFYAFNLEFISGITYTNGNVRDLKWKGKDQTIFTKGMVFIYDGANRLIESSGISAYKETESGIRYDMNGNITNLIRKDSTGLEIDKLAYSYTGNRLGSIADQGTASGVKSGTSIYQYDGNGNVISDGNRSATIDYNFLNLPKTIVIGSKTKVYDYDASGNKHKYYDLVYNAAVADTINIKYAGRFEYDKNNVVTRVAISEGQAVPNGSTIRFDYFLKDHIGNNRVTFNELGKTLLRTDYYPFGLSISRDVSLPENARNGINRYLYNDKELQVGSGYLDYGARMYMPEIGRFGAADRFGEKYVSVSGYQYALNNPIINIDLNGDSAWKITNLWNSSFMQQFSKELTSYIQKFEARKDKCTCDDLGLSVAMEFAKNNQLPFRWETESKSFDAASDEYSDFNTFSHDVKATSGAPDFQNSENTVPVNPKKADTGSIILNVKEGGSRAHHVQMVMGRSNDGNSLLIKQGNFVDFLRAQRVWGSGDPNSMRYLGTLIQTGTYNRQTDTWRNNSKSTSTANFSKRERLIYKAFNFANWNK